MTDTQLLALAIAIIFPLSMLIYSNSRITEAKETLRAELKTLETSLEKRIALLEANLEKRFTTLETNLAAAFEAAVKTHELEHHK